MAAHNPAQQTIGKRIGLSISTALLWCASILLILLAIIRWGIVPEIVAPTLTNYLKFAETELSSKLDKSVEISYSEVSMRFDTSNVFLSITEPQLIIDKNLPTQQSFSAKSAGLVVDVFSFDFDNMILTEPPSIFVKEADITVQFNEDENIALGNLSLFKNSDTTDTIFFPFFFLASDIQLEIVNADGSSFQLNDMLISVYPDSEHQSFILRINSSSFASTKLRLQATLFASENKKISADFYAQVIGGHLLPFFNDTITKSMSSEVQVWGNLDAGAVEATVAVEFTNLASQPNLAVTVVANKTKFLGEARWLINSNFVSGQWQTDVDQLTLAVSEQIIGDTLSFGNAYAYGNFTISLNQWQIVATARIKEQENLLAAQLQLSGVGSEITSIEVISFAPNLQASRAFALLPRSISPRGIDFLRNDLAIGQAHMTTLVIRGNPAGFPWHNDDSGLYSLVVDFSNARLNYLDTYPPLTDAHGRVVMRGNAMALTVNGAKIAGLPISKAYAAVDDLEIIPGTLYVSGQLEFAENQFYHLLSELPGPRTHLDNIPLRFDGNQVANLNIVVPLDNDDPVQIETELALTDTNLFWKPLSLTVSDVSGKINFKDFKVTGVGRGMLANSAVRLSTTVDQELNYAINIAGNFNLPKVASDFGYDLNALQVKGSSPASIIANNNHVIISSSLTGTSIDLPTPFGKRTNEKRSLTIEPQGDLILLNYGSNLLQAAIGVNGTEIHLGKNPDLIVPNSNGSRIQGSLNSANVDELLKLLIAQENKATTDIHLLVTIAKATFLDYEHNNLTVSLQAANTVTLAHLASDNLIADIAITTNNTIAISFAKLQIPRETTSSPAEDAIIRITPGTASGNLPPLQVTIPTLNLGTAVFENMKFNGQPEGDIWQLNQLKIHDATATLIASGSTAMSGDPLSRVTLNLTGSKFDEIVTNFGFDKDILGGALSSSGELSWRGQIQQPHLPSLEGTIAFTLSAFRMLQIEGKGAQLLRILSPFSLLTLGFLELSEEGVSFKEATGNLVFKGGNLNFENVVLIGEDISLEIAGSTNLITQRHNVLVNAKIQNTNSIFSAGAAWLINPALGGTLLLFDNILGKKIIKPAEINYQIQGTWDEPEIISEQTVPNQ